MDNIERFREQAVGQREAERRSRAEDAKRSYVWLEFIARRNRARERVAQEFRPGLLDIALRAAVNEGDLSDSEADEVVSDVLREIVTDETAYQRMVDAYLPEVQSAWESAQQRHPSQD